MPNLGSVLLKGVATLQFKRAKREREREREGRGKGWVYTAEWAADHCISLIQPASWQVRSLWSVCQAFPLLSPLYTLPLAAPAARNDTISAL